MSLKKLFVSEKLTSCMRFTVVDISVKDNQEKCLSGFTQTIGNGLSTSSNI